MGHYCDKEVDRLAPGSTPPASDPADRKAAYEKITAAVFWPTAGSSTSTTLNT